MNDSRRDQTKEIKRCKNTRLLRDQKKITCSKYHGFDYIHKDGNLNGIQLQY